MIALMALAGAVMVSCSDEESEIYFSSGDNPNAYTITMNEQQAWRQFIVNSSTDWTVETSDSWITLARTSYKQTETVGVFKVSYFAGYNTRVGTIRVKAGDRTLVITVIQTGSPFVRFASDNYQFTNQYSSVMMDIETNAELDANVEYVERNGDKESLIAEMSEDDKWLNFVINSTGTTNLKQLVLTAEANEDEQPRYARVIVKDSKTSATDTIHIEQLETDVFRIATNDDDKNTASYVLSSYNATEVTFTIDQNKGYSEEIPDDWISRNGSETRVVRETITYKVTENTGFDTRSGSVILTAEGMEPVVLNIEQPGHPLFIFGYYAYSAANRSAEEVKTNTSCEQTDPTKPNYVYYWTNFADFEISYSDDWIEEIESREVVNKNGNVEYRETITDGRGTYCGENAIYFDVTKNKGNKRIGQLTATCKNAPDNSYTTSINVVQDEFKPKASLSVKKQTMFLQDFETMTLAPATGDDAPNFEYKSIEWNSSNSDIVSVDEYGNVTALAKTTGSNTVKITATFILEDEYRTVEAKERTVECEITVADITLINKDTSEPLTAIVLDDNDEATSYAHIGLTAANFTVQSATWTSEDEDLAVLDPTAGGTKGENLKAENYLYISENAEEDGETSLTVTIDTGIALPDGTVLTVERTLPVSVITQKELAE